MNNNVVTISSDIEGPPQPTIDMPSTTANDQEQVLVSIDNPSRCFYNCVNSLVSIDRIRFMLIVLCTAKEIGFMYSFGGW
ncbi:hypothetical protein L2E82_51315 [Cichorium intybus]|nr:hypothetical protein L2E82_51315 [Cichorium intybus]